MHRPTVCYAVGLLWTCLLGSCQFEIAEVADIDPAVRKAAVVGGKEVSVCQFPSTVRVGGCTGTLIHPRVVTTAAHCLNSESASIRFGGGRDDPASFTIMGRCKAGARGQSGVGSSGDWGYCVLPEDERLKQLPITPPLVGCEAKRYLKPGATGWIVGYGTTGPQGTGGGVKRAVEVKVNRVSNGTVDVGDREVGACHGDSGGPIYMQLTDGANDYGLRVFGSTSGPGAPFCDCSCSTSYVDIAMHIEAIEENEDIDVTPCTDADGNWAPGPECNAIQTQAMNGGGTFPNCTVARTTAPINSCMMGAAPSAGSSAAMAGAPAAGSGVSASAGKGAGGNGVATAAGAASPSVAGMGAVAVARAGVPAAGSGAAVPSSTINMAGVRAPSASGAGTGAGGISATVATGTSTLGVTAAGGAAPASSPAANGGSEPAGCSCATLAPPRLGDAYSAAFCLLFGVGVLRRRAPSRRR